MILHDARRSVATLFVAFILCRFEFDGSKSAMRASIHTTEEPLEVR